MKVEADLTGWLGLEEALKTCDVIAFRAPIPGDTYLSVGGGICDSHGGVSEPRPILKKRSPTDDQVREAVKKALEDIGCVVTGKVQLVYYGGEKTGIGLVIKR